MKIKLDFVTNSSSISFIGWGLYVKNIFKNSFLTKIYYICSNCDFNFSPILKTYTASQMWKIQDSCKNILYILGFDGCCDQDGSILIGLRNKITATVLFESFGLEKQIERFDDYQGFGDYITEAYIHNG